MSEIEKDHSKKQPYSLKILSLRIIMVNIPFHARRYQEILRTRSSHHETETTMNENKPELFTIERKILNNVNTYDDMFNEDLHHIFPELGNSYRVATNLNEKKLLLLEECVMTTIIKCQNIEGLEIGGIEALDDYNTLSFDMLCSRINEIGPNVTDYIHNEIQNFRQVFRIRAPAERPIDAHDVSDVKSVLEVIYKVYENMLGEIPCLLTAIFITNNAENIDFRNIFTNTGSKLCFLVMITKGLTLKRMQTARIEVANNYRQNASLQKLCLSKIIESISPNIPNFMKTANYQNQHNIVAGPFEGLPDKFLNIIYNEYEKIIEEVPCVSSEIFLTRHTRTIKLQNITPAEERLLVTLGSKCQRNLTNLTLMNCEISDSVLGHLMNTLKNLTKLDLTGTMISDEIVGIISSNMKSLSELNLSNTNVTDTGLQHICEEKLQYLRILKLQDNINISASNVRQVISVYPDLIALENEHTFDALVFQKPFLIRITKLQSLEINVRKDQELSSVVLELFPDLSHLHLINYFPNMVEINQSLMSSFQSMFVKKLSVTGLWLNIGEVLLNFPCITELQFINCVLAYESDDFDVELIKNITSLHIENCDLTSRRVIEDIFFSQHLREITILNFKLANRFIMDMREGTSMHFNSLITNSMTTEFLKTIIMNNKNLQSILIRKPNDANIRDDFVVKINLYFREMIAGKISVASVNYDQVLRQALQCYSDALDYHPF